MPQTTEAMNVLMRSWFGSGTDETGPIEFLESHGYVLTRDWLWRLPTPAHTVNREEYACIRFLVEEWDFGGIVDSPIAYGEDT